MSTITYRAFVPDDAADVAQVFFDAVHRGTGTFYTDAQKTAWAGSKPEPERWRARLEGVFCTVAVADNRVVGFLTLDETGLIDMAFVAPHLAGTGVAFRLYQAAEAEAQNRGIAVLRTEASLSARPFFERQGWRLDAEQSVERNGIKLRNFRMSKQLRTR